MSQPIDYRNPMPGGARRQRIIAMLGQQEALDLGAIAFRLLIGIPLTLLAPLALTALIRGICWKWEIELPLTFLGSLLLLSLLVVPILMILERRTGGSFYADASQSAGKPDRAASYGEWELTRSTAMLNAYVEIALTGPRLLWEVIDRARGRSRVGPADPRLSAEIVEILLDAKQAVPVRDLILRGWPASEVYAAVTHLKHLGWADVSADGKRTWLAGKIAQRLV